MIGRSSGRLLHITNVEGIIADESTPFTSAGPGLVPTHTFANVARSLVRACYHVHEPWVIPQTFAAFGRILDRGVAMRAELDTVI